MTRVILATFFLAFTSNAISQAITVTNTFVDGQTASAAEVNQNFNDVVTGVNAIVQKDAQFNTATGADLLQFITSGEANTANGYQALFNLTTGDWNTAVGYRALRANETGGENTASGYQALVTNKEGSKNTASGSRALEKNSVGSFNTASGSLSLFNNIEGNSNTASGVNALFANTEGKQNTAIGSNALFENNTGNFNTAIGDQADVTTGALTNATAIGYRAKVDTSNKVRIGNTDVGVIEGQVAFSASSDARLKENITVVEAGLALVNDLNPVSYHRINNSRDDIEMGLLAQEVEEVLATHGLSNSGMVHQAGEDAYRSVRYNDLLAPMIRAIQELDSQHATGVTKKDEQIALLKRQLTDQSQQLKSQQEELLAVVQSQQEQMAMQQEQMAMQQEQMAMQQEQIAQLQRVVEHQFASR